MSHPRVVTTIETKSAMMVHSIYQPPNDETHLFWSKDLIAGLGACGNELELHDFES